MNGGYVSALFFNNVCELWRKIRGVSVIASNNRQIGFLGGWIKLKRDGFLVAEGKRFTTSATFVPVETEN